MIKIYHGTSVERGLVIARTGAIMPPYEVELARIRKNLRRDSKAYPEALKTLSIEELARKLARSGYPEREWEHRVERFSISTSKDIAKGYAEMFEYYSGGLLLELQVKEEILTANNVLYGEREEIRFLKEILPLENPLGIGISKQALLTSLDKIRSAFNKYNPNYELL